MCSEFKGKQIDCKRQNRGREPNIKLNCRKQLIFAHLCWVSFFCLHPPDTQPIILHPLSAQEGWSVGTTSMVFNCAWPLENAGRRPEGSEGRGWDQGVYWPRSLLEATLAFVSWWRSQLLCQGDPLLRWPSLHDSLLLKSMVVTAWKYWVSYSILASWVILFICCSIFFFCLFLSSIICLFCQLLREMS